MLTPSKGFFTISEQTPTCNYGLQEDLPMVFSVRMFVPCFSCKGRLLFFACSRHASPMGPLQILLLLYSSVSLSCMAYCPLPSSNLGSIQYAPETTLSFPSMCHPYPPYRHAAQRQYLLSAASYNFVPHSASSTQSHTRHMLIFSRCLTRALND